jgi:hypothetical protein
LSIVICKQCENEIVVPPSRVWRTTFCSNDCRAQHKQNELENRKRNCLFCSQSFVPRLYQIKNNNGKYCSAICRNKSTVNLLNTPEAQKKSKETYNKNLKLGTITHPSGKSHPRWKGGANELVKRRILDGRANASVKAYRKKNPDKVREWSTTRHKRKTGRLPKNTVKNKMLLQSGLCIYCKCDVTIKYHVDHIIPLAKGGKHEPSNIQILCPSCNVKKSAKLNFSLSYSSPLFFLPFQS